MNLTDLIGYLGTIVVLASFMVNSNTKLRILNLIGCSIFVIYGFMLNTAWPVVITNVLIVCIHLYQLTKAAKVKKK